MPPEVLSLPSSERNVTQRHDDGKQVAGLLGTRADGAVMDR